MKIFSRKELERVFKSVGKWIKILNILTQVFELLKQSKIRCKAITIYHLLEIILKIKREMSNSSSRTETTHASTPTHSSHDSLDHETDCEGNCPEIPII